MSASSGSHGSRRSTAGIPWKEHQAQLKLGRRRGLLVLLAVLVLALVAYTQWPREDRIARTGSSELPAGSVSVAKRTLRAYAIDYLVRTKSTGSDDVVTSRERIVVRRPFDAKTPEGVSTFTRASFGDQVLAVPPDIPDVDLRPGAVLREALRKGRAEERERRRVAGRVCRVYRVTGISRLDHLKTSADEYTDVCIDESGVVLEEVDSVDGEIVLLKVAESVDESPDVDEEDFDLGEPSIGVSVGGNSVQELRPDSRLPGGKFWDLDTPLAGFHHRGRYAVTESDPVERKIMRTSVTDVWTRGTDVVFIERFNPGRSGQALEDEEANSDRVDAGKIGRGKLIYSLRTSEVRVATGSGRVVRVRGTLAPSRLLAIARSLKPLPEGPLVPLHTD